MSGTTRNNPDIRSVHIPQSFPTNVMNEVINAAILLVMTFKWELMYTNSIDK